MLLLCNYYVTYRCNADCLFCHFGNSSDLNSVPFANISDVINNLKQLKKLLINFIDFTGGEPLLYQDLYIALAEAKKLRIQTSITTNCLLYPKYAEKIKNKVNLLHFSLDSPDADEHNKIRKINCFNKVIESIDIAKQLKEHPDILFTVTNETYNKLPEMYDFARNYDLLLIINPLFSYFNNTGLNIEAIDYIQKYIKSKKFVYINPAFLKLRKDGGNQISNPKCKAVSRVIVISPDNKILLPCYHLAKDEIVINKPIKEIRKSDKVKYYKRMEGRFDFCQGCTINCYFEPSFAFPTNFYGLVSLYSKINYSYQKLIKQNNSPK